MKNKNLTFFLFVVLINTILTYIAQEVIITEDLLINSYKKNLTESQILKILSFRESFSWVSYVLAPVLFLLKFSIIALLIKIGLYFRQYTVKYSQIFRIAILGEFVKLGYLVLKFCLLLIKDFNSLQEMQEFWPLSLASILKNEFIVNYFKYAIITINIGEIVYWLVISWLLSKVVSTKYMEGIRIILGTYGFGLILWMIVLIFGQLYLG